MRSDGFCVISSLFIIILVDTLCIGAYGGQDPNAPVQLEEYLKYAALHNAGLRSSFEQWRYAVLAIEPAGALEDPRFTYGYFIEEVETRVGPQKHRLGIMQTFPWFGVLEARTDAAAAAAKAARQRYEAKKLELFGQTEHAFHEYVYLDRALRIAEQNLELLRFFEQVAQARYRTAAGRHPDIIRAQIELATLEDHITSLRQMREPIVAGLNAILNRKAESLLPWPVREEESLVTLEIERFLDNLTQTNPELAALQFEVAAARSRLELAAKRYYPNVSLGLDWIITDDARMPNTWGSGRDPIIAMVSLNIPIWTDSYKAQENQARSQVRRARQDKEQKEYDLIAQIVQSVYDLEDSRRKAVLYRDILIPKAMEMIETSEEAYRTGNLDFLSLVDAQRKQLLYELAYQRSLSWHLQQRAKLEQLLGGNIRDPGKSYLKSQ